MALVIPTIFTATNKLSPELQKMRGDVISFANSAERKFGKFDKTVRSLVPGLNSVQKSFSQLASTGAALGAGFLGASSFNSLANYEAAVDSFRVIVSDLNDTQFSVFENKIMEVAKITKRGGTEVATAFEKIAGINEKFAATADGLGDVTQATITLAKASRMELGVAAENLVGIMNQFSFGTNQANRTINALAAGQAIGAANISQTAESFTIFGAVAADSNITLEQSVGLIQTLGKFSLYGAEAGTKLRGVIMRLQRAGLGYASGQFKINDALKDTNKFLDHLKTQKEKDIIVNKLFGVENVTAGRILLNNIGLYEEFTQRVTGTTEAYKAAEINSGNLRMQIQQLGAAWENALISNTNAGAGMKTISDVVVYLTNNIQGLLTGIVAAVKTFAIYTAAVWTIKKAFVAWNVTLGISSALLGNSALAMAGNTTALAAQNATLVIARALGLGYAASTETATAATIGFNAALAANPVFFIVGGILALTAALVGYNYIQNQSNEAVAESIRLKNEDFINAERNAIDKLTESYVQNNIERKKAIAFGLSERAMQARNEIAKYEAQRTEAAIAMNKYQVGSYEYQIAQGKQTNAEQTIATRKRQLGVIQEEAIRAKSEGFISGVNLYNITQGKPLNFMSQSEIDKFMKKEQSPVTPEIFLEEMKTKIKNELSITINNQSNGTATVESGGKSFSVQPGIISTKELQAAK